MPIIDTDAMTALDLSREPIAVRVAVLWALGYRPLCGRWMPSVPARVWS